jgi:hypothetical protein
MIQSKLKHRIHKSSQYDQDLWKAATHVTAVQWTGAKKAPRRHHKNRSARIEECLGWQPQKPNPRNHTFRRGAESLLFLKPIKRLIWAEEGLIFKYIGTRGWPIYSSIGADQRDACGKRISLTTSNLGCILGRCLSAAIASQQRMHTGRKFSFNWVRSLPGKY